MRNIVEPISKKIICRVHSDGDITKGTSNEIVARIHNDGDITQGTGNRIIGRMSEDNYSSGFERNVGRNGDDGIGVVAFVMAAFFVVGGLFFAIFMLPGQLMEMMGTMIEENDIEELVSLVATLITACVGSVFGNIIAGKMARLSTRIQHSFITSYVLQILVLIIMDTLYYHDLKGVTGFLSVLIVPALIAVLPALIISVICRIIVR